MAKMSSNFGENKDGLQILNFSILVQRLITDP